MLIFRRVVIAGTILYWLALFTATHIPPAKLPPIHSDKTIHFVSYAILAAALYLSLHVTRRAKETALLVLLIGLAYGAIDEWLQIPVGRTCEMADWYADAAGVAVGVIVVSLILRFVPSRS